MASFLRKPREDALLVPWTFSHPGDLDFDAFGLVKPLASREDLGSNQLAAVIVAFVGSGASTAVGLGFAALASAAALEVVAFVGSDSFRKWFGSFALLSCLNL